MSRNDYDFTTVMGDDADRHLSLLERLDLALAMRAAREVVGDVHPVEVRAANTDVVS